MDFHYENIYSGKKLFGVIFPRVKPGFKFLSQNVNIEAMEDTNDHRI